jgi:D-xylose transport system substrate-binding protein
MKLKNLLFGFLIVLVFSSCFKETTVGILFDSRENERWFKDEQLILEKFNEKEINALFRLANGDAQLQFQQAKELIDSGAQILIIAAVDLLEAAKIVELAHRNGIKVISYDRLIKDSSPDLYISFDNVEVGRLQAEYLTKICPTGNYAIIGGATSDNNSYLLRIGQMNVLQPLIEKGDINLVYDQFVDYWSEDSGYEHMKRILSKAEVDAVVAANDQLATGAVRAIFETDSNLHVYISGQDASLEACRNILQGEQTMTVYKPIEAITEKTVDITLRMLNDQPIPENTTVIHNGFKLIPSILLSPSIVNKETMNLTVIADGYIDAQDLGLPIKKKE